MILRQKLRGRKKETDKLSGTGEIVTRDKNGAKPANYDLLDCELGRDKLGESVGNCQS